MTFNSCAQTFLPTSVAWPLFGMQREQCAKRTNNTARSPL